MTRKRQNDFYHKLDEMGFSNQNNDSNHNEMNSFEEKFQINLPEDYRDFVLQYAPSHFTNECYYQPKVQYPCSSVDGFEPVVVFYNLEKGDLNLRKQMEDLKEGLPDFVIPIAEAPGGDQICLAVKGKQFGRVFYWDHEFNPNVTNQSTFGLYLTADTFTDFILSFQVFHRELKKQGELVEFWLDDDLLSD